MITVENLTKKYGKKTAVQNLSFEVPDGQVTGFLGPNGSGKSTTMRCILGLDKPQAGSTYFSSPDGSYHGEFATLKTKTQIAGAMLDANWFNPGRSGKAHLHALAAGAGIKKRRVAEVTDLVGIGSVINKRVGGYSLGMKQRLMLAAALLGDPQHLLLDEPVNGLDPEGVTWMRNTIRNFANEGKTVLVSSHLLSEMQLTADRLVVIGNGQMIGSYTMSEFLSGGTKLHIETPHLEKLADLLTTKALNFAIIRNNEQNRELVVTVPAGVSDSEFRNDIANTAFNNGILITNYYIKQANLEEKFLAATAKAQEFRTQTA